ncbi:alpha/beta fold hydrolase [Cyclobacterium plantarum]|nr:alpha/beta fold hydrolase [Cyclobacterium plantarum]
MKKSNMRSCFFGGIILIISLIPIFSKAQSPDTLKRKAFLEDLRELNRPHPRPEQRARNVFASFERLSYKDSTWDAWQKRTGELPPDFDSLPDLPFLPDPLILDEGGRQIPVETMEQWQAKREWIQEQVKLLLSGTFPDPPENFTSEILSEHQEGEIKVQTVLLKFGDHEKARLTLEVFTPSGDGPHPVFMSQWNHRGWVQIAVRRGYMGVIYAGADVFDETISYQEVYPEYDWSALMTRAWGAHRAVDYLYTLPHVDKDKIALTGHSRNAKLSIFAAAFDPRITALISSSGGTGGEIPYRYTDERHENESIDYLNSIRPQWFHPRLRFFNGREHKLPIDQNSLMALIAPNALLLSSSIREAGGGDPWAIEQNYKSLRQVYDFLGQPDKLGIRFRDGKHAVAARDIESFVDWLDIQFGRSDKKWNNKRYYSYDFDSWEKGRKPPGLLNEQPVALSSLMDNTATLDQSGLNAWQEKVRERIRWTLGKQPEGIAASPISNLSNNTDYLDLLLNRPQVSNGIRRNIAPYNALGDYQHGAIYLPSDDQGEFKPESGKKIPMVIYLHKYVNTGFDTGMNHFIETCLAKGMAVFTMDLLGYGSRIEEGSGFYNRYPNWSKMGKMVKDTRDAIQAVGQLPFVDTNQLYLAGYALGGTVALFTAALEEQVAGVAVASAFTPLREAGAHMEGIKAYSHLYGLIPNWGYYTDHPSAIPVDFPEILATILPRPLMVVSPAQDRHADLPAISRTLQNLKKITHQMGDKHSPYQYIPKGFNRFGETSQDKMIDWIHQHTQQTHD